MRHTVPMTYTTYEYDPGSVAEAESRKADAAASELGEFTDDYPEDWEDWGREDAF